MNEKHIKWLKRSIYILLALLVATLIALLIRMKIVNKPENNTDRDVVSNNVIADASESAQ